MWRSLHKPLYHVAVGHYLEYLDRVPRMGYSFLSMGLVTFFAVLFLHSAFNEGWVNKENGNNFLFSLMENPLEVHPSLMYSTSLFFSPILRSQHLCNNASFFSPLKARLYSFFGTTHPLQIDQTIPLAVYFSKIGACSEKYAF